MGKTAAVIEDLQLCTFEVAQPEIRGLHRRRGTFPSPGQENRLLEGGEIGSHVEIEAPAEMGCQGSLIASTVGAAKVSIDHLGIGPLRGCEDFPLQVFADPGAGGEHVERRGTKNRYSKQAEDGFASVAGAVLVSVDADRRDDSQASYAVAATGRGFDREGSALSCRDHHHRTPDDLLEQGFDEIDVELRLESVIASIRATPTQEVWHDDLVICRQSFRHLAPLAAVVARPERMQEQKTLALTEAAKADLPASPVEDLLAPPGWCLDARGFSLPPGIGDGRKADGGSADEQAPREAAAPPGSLFFLAGLSAHEPLRIPCGRVWIMVLYA